MNKCKCNNEFIKTLSFIFHTNDIMHCNYINYIILIFCFSVYTQLLYLHILHFNLFSCQKGHLLLLIVVAGYHTRGDFFQVVLCKFSKPDWTQPNRFVVSYGGNKLFYNIE